MANKTLPQFDPIETLDAQDYLYIFDKQSGKSYKVLAGDLAALAGPVLSVNQKAGAVLLSSDDISDLGRVNRYVTEAEKGKINILSNTAGARFVLCGDGVYRSIDDLGIGGSGGGAIPVATIADRDLLGTNIKDGQLVIVRDASADTSVDTGSAMYAWNAGLGVWDKQSELESMDLVLTTMETFADIHSDFVAKGLVYSTSANFTASYTAGVVYAGGMRWAIAAGSSTVAASSDTYVDVNSTGAIVLTGVALGGAAPAIAAGSVRIAKLVSDATAVTGVTDLRQGDYNINTVNAGKFKVNGKEIGYNDDRAPTAITPASTVTVAFPTTTGRSPVMLWRTILYASGNAITAVTIGTTGMIAGDRLLVFSKNDGTTDVTYTVSGATLPTGGTNPVVKAAGKSLDMHLTANGLITTLNQQQYG